MLRILTVLCLIGAVFAHMGGEAMLKKYAGIKIMSSCMGEETVMSWKTQMKAACDTCKGKDVMQTVIDLQAMLKDMRKNYSPFTRQGQQQPIYVPVPMYMPQNQYQQYQPLYKPQNQYQQYQPFRTKRSFDLSPAGIEEMRTNMMTKISNVTCVLKEMNYIDDTNQPNYEYFNEEINNLTVDEGLKEDFREAMDMCRDFAMCMPVEKAKSPIKKELGTALAFMKCCNMKKIMVCMKNDLKKYAPMMGFEGDLEMPEGQELIDEITNMITEGMDFM